ncbi:LLM class flavin-dependent oxidoreductase [Ramlibacter sp. AW1]|uniref:LLM class flavin-dependent oxidoreductase n=1 Tax=Ramlibacter aurantiacus TaxID=2801330 RepID=A0A936ZK93_9BURK|nr:MupA/Atu3671 family FMN-dependent luciferase-like monooxygenase [Ramlibacter aurantiacus]MBL0422889.1 LLM class flavin-dependent oxidoreductase [Ramlibacter aurantiacus]
MFKPSCAVFVGDGTLLIRCAQAYRSEGHQIAAVASADPAILEWARQQGITAEAITGGAPRLEGIAFDHLFSVAWLHVLPEDLVRRAGKLALNFHDGPLPRYAGLNATAWALMAGERQHGVTWHEMTAKVDEGRIACQTLFELSPDETAFSLNARCYEAGFQAFCSLLPGIASGDLALQPQQGERSYFGRHHRPPELATLDFSRPSAELHALGRGLAFGNYANPLALCKVWLGGDELLLVRGTRLPGTRTAATPGTVLDVQGDRLRVATADGDLVLEGCCRPDGSAPGAELRPGLVLPALDASRRQQLNERAPRLARGEVFWREALAQVRPLQLPYPLHTPSTEDRADAPRVLRLEAVDRGPATLAAFAAWLAALSGQDQVSLAYADAALADASLGIEAWASARVPVTLAAQPAATVAQACASAESVLAQARQAGPLTRDLRLRAGAQPQAQLPSVGLSLGGAGTGSPLLLELRAGQPGQPLELHVDARAFSNPVAQLMARHLDAWLQAFARADGSVRVGDLGLLPPHEAAQVDASNDGTAVAVDLSQPVHGQIVQAAAAKPDAEALRWDDQALTRGELHARSDALARVLGERGVRPGDAVGVCLERSLDLVVSVLAILKAGAAYLPLDPEYPRERLRYMVADSATRLVVCRAEQAAMLDLPPAQAVSPDAAPASPGTPLPAVRADSTAYLIYTSGSTGQPKGVMVTHANVLNFFAGMDRRVPRDEGSRWLAVTSLSFDISVLELLWTLSRGVPVVLYSSASAQAQASGPDFSLFYFSSDESAADTADRYRLLMEGARFADENGFAAVWTPERHFHAFGGLYPNPMVASAAIAAITRRVQIRAGSCVLPLHHPARVAEDWSLVDNLSRGRVGVSFAAGWQPNDFVLAPQNFANRKQLMLDGIDTVRRLWSGETVEFPGHDGKPVAVRTLPRPVQRQLPMWLTAASNPETFQQAGEKGCNVLTHLLGQTVEDVAQKVAVYREAWRKAGHSGQGQVTLMLHTFVGPDEEQVREIARGPMKTYLRSSVDLIRQAAWSFPTFVQRGAAAGRTPLEVMQEQPLTDAEMDALLDHAFSRYWNTSALIGTPERCLAMVQKLQDAGVNEIACLIDFGIATDTVLSQLHDLRRLMQLAQQPRRAPMSVATQLARHGITHLQCTPSMATMLVADAEGRAGLSKLSALLVGGEALPLPLATQLRELVPGKLLNMYGPTETTVWSSCADLAQIGELVPLGEPIANTRLHVRNAWGQECPALVPGELLIGGDGVTRGYLNRPELNAERFIADERHPGQRLYRTGDLVRRHPDGRLEFLGRLDHQVKIRGHRIELGEIENTLASQPGVREAVVIARQDTAGEAFLVGYVTAAAGQPAPDADTLRRALAERLPDIMVPRLISVRASFPLTPNGKIDRKALAQAAAPATGAPAAPAAPTPAASAAPHDPLEQTVAGIWCQVLGLPEVGRESNFFDLGGHSLLVIQVQRRLKEAVGQEVSITDMFRLTTVAAIAGHLRGGGDTRDTAVNEGLSRAQARRALRSQARTA